LIAPDREFPAEVRHLLNEAFGEIAQRARKVDLRTLLLRDMCDLFTEQLELYRSTKATVGIVSEGDLRLASKDRAFQQEMKTNRTLHAAFYSRDGHYRMIRRMSEGVVSLILKKDVNESPGLKALARELLASCVLRQIVLLFAPYNANKCLLSILCPKEYGKMAKLSESDSREEASTGQRALFKKDSFGRVKFEHRVRKSVLLEEKATKPKSRSIETVPHIVISKSHPNLRSKDLQKDTMESTLPEPGLQSWESSVASIEDLKEVMEETDLLRDEALDLPDSALDSTRASTSSPTKLSSDIFDRQVSIEDMGFVGLPKACVVAPEINTNGGREYVVFKIRVSDQSGEWTVTRRYRNFEALHRLLRDVPVYRELDPRLPPKRFFLPTHKTEVVEQRRVALDRYLQTILSSELLAKHRDVWLFLSDQTNRSFKPDVNVGFVKLIVDNVDNARYQIKRKVVDSFRSQSRSDIREEKALRGLEDSEDSSVAGSIKLEEDSNMVGTNNPSPPIDSNAPSLIKTTVGHDRKKDLAGLEGSSPFSNEKSYPLPTDLTRTPKGIAAKKSPIGKASVSAIFYEDHDLPGKLSSANLLSRFEYQDRDAIGRQVEKSMADFGQLKRTRSWSRSAQVEDPYDEDDGGTSSSPEESEFEDCTGISAPLYEVADAIFSFPAQNVFRRQFLQVMRQIFSLLAGDAIDVYLNEKVKRLRSEHTIAWLIHWLKSLLWPNGVWFTTVETEGKTPNDPKSQPLKSVNYLEANEEEEVDAKEVADKLRVRLFRRAPAALVRLVGRNNYMKAMKEVYDMIQLKTFIRQIGYGVLEIGLLALFPELKDLFAKIHMEAKNRPESH